MTKHEICHLIDEHCCAMMEHLTTITPACLAIDADAEMDAVADTIKALHAKATQVHAECTAH